MPADRRPGGSLPTRIPVASRQALTTSCGPQIGSPTFRCRQPFPPVVAEPVASRPCGPTRSPPRYGNETSRCRLRGAHWTLRRRGPGPVRGHLQSPIFAGFRRWRVPSKRPARRRRPATHAIAVQRAALARGSATMLVLIAAARSNLLPLRSGSAPHSWPARGANRRSCAARATPLTGGWLRCSKSRPVSRPN